MKTWPLTTLVAAFALLPAAASPSGEATRRADQALERAFPSGGAVELDLSAGEYRILRGGDDKLTMEWWARNPEDLERVRVSAEVSGKTATVRTSRTRNHFSAVIRVPARTDIELSLSAGDLDIEGIEGNKDVRVNAGDVDIQMGPAGDYGQVTASLWAGDLKAEPLGIRTEGLFRSFDWKGKGRYRLTVRLLAGDVRLYEGAPSK
jgi:hypothetical protein